MGAFRTARSASGFGGSHQTPATSPGAGTPDSVAANGVTYARVDGAGVTPPGVPASLGVPTYPAGGAAPPAGSAFDTIPAVGHWMQVAGECKEFADVQLQESSVTIRDASGQSETDQTTFSNTRPTSFTISRPWFRNAIRLRDRTERQQAHRVAIETRSTCSGIIDLRG